MCIRDRTYSVRTFFNGDRQDVDCTGQINFAPAPTPGPAPGPAPGQLACTQTVVNGSVVIEWDDLEGINFYQIRVDDAWRASVNPGVERYEAPNEGTQWMIRYRPPGQTITVNCDVVDAGPAPTPAPAPGVPALACSVTTNGNQVTISWNAADWERVAIRRDGIFVVNPLRTATSFIDTAGFATATYSVRTFFNLSLIHISEPTRPY